MTTLTDYIVLSDGAFELDSTPAAGAPSEEHLTFTLPSDFTIGINLARPVLAFIVNFRSDDGSCGIWVNPTFPLLQSTRVQTLSWNNPHHLDSGLWEALQGTQFRPGEENRIVFGMQEGDDGHVRFRDVVLWFQREA